MYFAMFFFLGTIGLIDSGLNNIRKFIKQRRMISQEAAEFEQKALEARDPKNIRHRQTHYVHTGYAFSQAAGQDGLVTDLLA